MWDPESGRESGPGEEDREGRARVQIKVSRLRESPSGAPLFSVKQRRLGGTGKRLKVRQVGRLWNGRGVDRKTRAGVLAVGCLGHSHGLQGLLTLQELGPGLG